MESNENQGTIICEHCEFDSNTAEISGGVAHNDGYCGMTIINCNVHDNKALNNYSADVYGGAFDNYGNLDIDHSTVTNNEASLSSVSYGGAISNWGILNVFDSEISGNSAYMGAGVYNGPSLIEDVSESKSVISYSKIKGNTATYYGGVLNQSGVVFVTKCEIDENVANAGAGVANFGNTYLFDNQVKNNISDSYGAGIYNTAYMEIDAIEVTGNNGIGMVLDGGSSTWMCGKIICKNNTSEDPAFIETDYVANCILLQGQTIFIDEPTGLSEGTELHYDIVGENQVGDFVEISGRATTYYGQVNGDSAAIDAYLHYDAFGKQS